MINFKDKIRTNDLEMYIAFRNELDAMEFPRMVGEPQIAYMTIECDGFDVGFLLVNKGYVIGIYIKQEYRRRGLARNAVIEYLENGGIINSLEILDCNIVARYFWESLFDLKPERYSSTSTVFRASLKASTQTGGKQ